MADEKAKIVIDGDVSPLRQKLREAGDAMNRFGDSARRAVDGVNSPLSIMTTRLGAFTAVLAAGGFAAFVRGAINAQDALNDMSIRTGVAVGTLAGLEYAAKLGDISMQDLSTSVGKLSKFIGEAEGGNKKYQEILKLLGITAKEPEQALIQLADATTRLHNPTERAAVLSQVLGRGYQTMLPLLEGGGAQLQQLIERGRELNPVTAESAKQAAEFNDRVDELTSSVKTLGVETANKLLPSLIEIANAARNAAKEHGILYGAIIAVGTAFKTFMDGGAKSPLQKQQVFVKELETDLIKLQKELVDTENKSIGRLFRRDPQQIKNEINAIKLSLTDARLTLADMENKSLGFGAAPETKKPGISVPKNLFGDDKEKKEKAAPESFMQYYEAALDEEKRLAYERDALRGYTKQQELAFWQNLIANADLRSKDRVAIERKVSTLIVDIKRAEAKQKTDLDAETIRAHEALALGRLEVERAAARAGLDVGQITKAEFLTMEEGFERQRYDIQRTALEERLKLLEQDPNTNPVEFERIKNQLLELEQQYQLKRAQLHGEMQQEDMQIWESLTNRLSSLWDKGLQAMMNGTLTWRNAMRAIWTELSGWFVSEVIGKQVKDWIAGETKKIALKLGFTAQEKVIETAKSASTMATKATEATAVVGSNAAEAASGGASAMASIPYVGPILAAAAFASIMGMVLGARSQIKSAAKGYDIPKGLNPMTQLHEEEMVLPQKYANVIRGIAGQGAGGGEEGGGSVHIYARNDNDVVRVGDVKKLLRDMRRDFVDVRVR